MFYVPLPWNMTQGWLHLLSKESTQYCKSSPADTLGKYKPRGIKPQTSLLSTSAHRTSFSLWPPSAVAAFKGFQSAMRGVSVERQSQESLWFWCRQTDLADCGWGACVFGFSQQAAYPELSGPRSLLCPLSVKKAPGRLTLGTTCSLRVKMTTGVLLWSKNFKVVSRRAY